MDATRCIYRSQGKFDVLFRHISEVITENEDESWIVYLFLYENKYVSPSSCSIQIYKPDLNRKFNLFRKETANKATWWK